GKLPPLTDTGTGAPNGWGFSSLFFNILPYVEQDNVYRVFQKATPSTYYAATTGAARTIIPTYISPADSTASNGTTMTGVATTASGTAVAITGGEFATTSYAANGYVFRSNTGGLPRTFVDGTSNTIMFAERYQVCTPASGSPVYNLWAFGRNDAADANSKHPSPAAFYFIAKAGTAPENTATIMLAPVVPLPPATTPPHPPSTAIPRIL